MLSEAFPSVWPTGASAPIPMVRYSTINVRGELIDDTPPGTGPNAHIEAHRTQTGGGCSTRQTVTNDGNYDPSVVPDQDGRYCLVTHNGVMGAVTYNGSDYPQGHTTNFGFDSVGRANRTVDDTSTFIEPAINPVTGRQSEAAALSTHSATTSTFDAENHTISRQVTRTVTTSKPDQGTATTRTSTTPATTLGWGPNGHPVLVHNAGYSATAQQDQTLHWDGDMVLFVTDANGSVVDFKVGLDGEITPRDASWTGLTMYDRDTAGVVIAGRNATGQSNLVPLDPWNGNDIGFGPGVAAGLRNSTLQYAFYARPDGFKINDIQINGVRAFDPALGSWTTPDAFEGDVHDPASQQKYMWNRGNAVDYSDPSGYQAIGQWVGPLIDFFHPHFRLDPSWKANYHFTKSGFATKALGRGHFDKHVTARREFNFSTVGEYIKASIDFRNNPGPNSEARLDSHSGILRIYDPKSNTFGSYNSDGTTKTFFKPVDGPKYWNDLRLNPGLNVTPPGQPLSSEGYLRSHGFNLPGMRFR